MNLRLLVVAAIFLPSAAAFAQADPMQMAQVASANQIGVMEYCKAKGWVDQQAVDAQRAAASGMPAATDTRAAAAAEATGREGSLLNNGTPMSLAAMARQTNTSEASLCGQMGESVKMVAAQRGAMPTMPGGFPAMPGGMPALPNGMTMPTMPGIPKQ